MIDLDSIYQSIRAQGGRITKVRRAILQVFASESCLLSQADLLARLEQSGLSPNRSTLFRELGFLVDRQILVRNSILGQDYYELPKDHHHHLVCLGCGTIRQVIMPNQLQVCEAGIKKDNDFEIVHHALEFYGYCAACQNESIDR